MAAGDLTTLEKVKRYLRPLDETTVADDVLADLITQASSWVKRELGGRDILQTTYTETRDGTGKQRLLLKRWPVISVTSVTVDGEAIPARATVTGDGWVLRENGIDLVGYYFNDTTTQNVVIVYSAGYASVPEDLELAVIELVALKYRRRGNLGNGSSTQDGMSITYTDGGVLAGVRDVMARYSDQGFA